LNPGLKILLQPVGLAWGLVTLARNRLYDWRILRERHFDLHTIGVGNLAAGGAGKTPLVEYLIRLMKANNYSVATLSRGYKRKTKGFVLADDTSDAADIGDEPLMYKTKYDVSVAVDARRVNGVQKLASMKHPPDVILLDDVFQHRSIRCGLNILVTDFNNIFYRDSMLPAGTLREFRSGVSRADILIVSKTPDRTTPVEIRNILKDVHPRPHQRVFFSYLRYGELYSASNPLNKMDTLNELFRYVVISFAGIANAQPMIDYLKEYSAEHRHLPFPDHYAYTPKDMQDIERYYHSFKATNKILVTTEKDLMRLRYETVWPLVSSMNIYVLPVEVTFRDKEDEFNDLILKYVSRNKFHHEKYSRGH
jgi:tetraacyldisaccharide 4'-kinase